MAKDRERREALALLQDGLSVTGVARRLSVSRRSVYNWLMSAQENEEGSQETPGEPVEDQKATQRLPEPLSPRNITEERAEQPSELAEGHSQIPSCVYIRDEEDAAQYLKCLDLADGDHHRVVRDQLTDRYIATPKPLPRWKPSLTARLNIMFFGSERSRRKVRRQSERCLLCGKPTLGPLCRSCGEAYKSEEEMLRAKSLGSYAVEKV